MGESVELHVPRVHGSILLDGDLDDTGWAGPIARTGAFVDRDGVEARPYSDARVVWGDNHLYFALYAADEDVRTRWTDADSPVWLDDSFHLVFDDGESERIFDVSPTGTVADAMRKRSAGGGAQSLDFGWNSGIHVSHELDGTLNMPDDDDEEWALELAIPFEALGLSGRAGDRIGLALHRCDTPHHNGRVCASWGEGASGTKGVLILD